MMGQLLMRLMLGVALSSLLRRREDSSREDVPELEGLPWSSPGGDQTLSEALGVAYVYGGGREPGSWPLGSAVPQSAGVPGYDCSGYVDAALRELGAVLPWEQSSASVATFTRALPLQAGEPPPGSIAVYGSPPSHAMLVGSDGRVYGASGGGSRTFGSDPSAYVKVFDGYDYRADYQGYLWPW